MLRHIFQDKILEDERARWFRIVESLLWTAFYFMSTLYYDENRSFIVFQRRVKSTTGPRTGDSCLFATKPQVGCC